MTAKERNRLRKLEIENQYLRAEVHKQSGTLRNYIYQIVDLKTKLDLVEEVVTFNGKYN